MATLPTGGFNLRTLPQLAAIDPQDFRAGLGELIRAFEATMALPGRLEGVRQLQREGEIGRRTQPQRLELAEQQAADALTLQPYLTAASRERALGDLTEPAGGVLTEDERGLVQTTTKVRRDPVTGEEINLSTDTVLKTPQQIERERLSATALAEQREAQAELSRARAAAAAAKTQLDREKMLRALDSKKSVRMFKNEDVVGRTTGYVAAIFDTTTGDFITQELDARGQPIGEPSRSKQLPTSGEVDPKSIDSPESSPTTPQVARPSRVSLLLDDSALTKLPASGQPVSTEGAVSTLPLPGGPVSTEGALTPARVPQITTDAQYNALPSGTTFRDPNGVLRRKP